MHWLQDQWHQEQWAQQQWPRHQQRRQQWMQPPQQRIRKREGGAKGKEQQPQYNNVHLQALFLREANQQPQCNLVSQRTAQGQKGKWGNAGKGSTGKGRSAGAKGQGKGGKSSKWWQVRKVDDALEEPQTLDSEKSSSLDIPSIEVPKGTMDMADFRVCVEQLPDSENPQSFDMALNVHRSLSKKESGMIQLPYCIVAMDPSANAKDMADWIGAFSCVMFNLSPNVWMVPFEMVIIGFDVLQQNMSLLAASHWVCNRIIIFAPERKQCKWGDIELRNLVKSENKLMRFLKISDETVYNVSVRERPLSQALEFGVGLIHEGFAAETRASIEHLFLARAIQLVGAVSGFLATIGFIWVIYK